MSDKKLCNNKYRNFTCNKEAGHEGTHQFLEAQDYPSFTFVEWNNKGEQRLPYKMVEFPCAFDTGREKRVSTMNDAILDAKKTLPEGAVYEIRAKNYPGDKTHAGVSISQPEDWAMAWVFILQQEGFEPLEPNHDFQDLPLFQNDVDKGRRITLGGYVLLARIKV